MLDSFIGFFNAIPDNVTEEENLFEDGDWAILEWRGSGTMLGPLGPHAPTGKSFTLRGCGFFHILNGEIVFQRGYIDRASWFEQMGI